MNSCEDTSHEIILSDDDGVAAGTEHNAIMLYVKKHNMTFAKILEQDDKWGIVFENFTGMGIMGRVVEDEADLAFSMYKLMLHSNLF